jgi:hypothetical protein
MINTEKLERSIAHLLQRNIQFSVGEKILRKGKLVIFKVKDFYITFTIINDKGETKYYDLPYPFVVRASDTGAEFDYTLDSLAKGNKMLYYRLKVLNRVKKNKLYDNVLNITQVD